jgi:hypothetical protein
MNYARVYDKLLYFNYIFAYIRFYNLSIELTKLKL